MKKLLSVMLLLALTVAGEANELAESEIMGSFALGFRECDASALRADFNDAILSMKLDGTMTILQAKHLGAGDHEAVSFRTYNDADTVRIAAADDAMTRFNVAVLADISRRLRVNVELININADEQISALTSGNVDAVLLHKPGMYI